MEVRTTTREDSAIVRLETNSDDLRSLLLDTERKILSRREAFIANRNETVRRTLLALLDDTGFMEKLKSQIKPTLELNLCGIPLPNAGKLFDCEKSELRFTWKGCCVYITRYLHEKNSGRDALLDLIAPAPASRRIEKNEDACVSEFYTRIFGLMDDYCNEYVKRAKDSAPLLAGLARDILTDAISREVTTCEYLDVGVYDRQFCTELWKTSFSERASKLAGLSVQLDDQMTFEISDKGKEFYMAIFKLVKPAMPKFVQDGHVIEVDLSLDKKKNLSVRLPGHGKINTHCPAVSSRPDRFAVKTSLIHERYEATIIGYFLRSSLVVLYGGDTTFTIFRFVDEKALEAINELLYDINALFCGDV
jgi:hypothetical protein